MTIGHTSYALLTLCSPFISGQCTLPGATSETAPYPKSSWVSDKAATELEELEREVLLTKTPRAPSYPKGR